MIFIETNHRNVIFFCNELDIFLNIDIPYEKKSDNYTTHLRTFYEQ